MGNRDRKGHVKRETRDQLIKTLVWTIADLVCYGLKLFFVGNIQQQPRLKKQLPSPQTNKWYIILQNHG